MIAYELSLELAFQGEEITDECQKDILAYLRILKLRDEPTYQHSIRVGLLAEKIAGCLQEHGITPKMLLWAGLLHDIGKALIPPDILNKKAAFTPEDYAAMEPHAKYGWDMLSNVHDYTAQIIVRHHQFGPHPYPAVLPPLPEYLNGKGQMIATAARLLALADYYDALMSRDNEKFGSTPLTPAEKRDQYFRDNLDMAELVLQLEAAGIFKF
jgi:putative nucleotidyltransferase with HDIG domain